MQIPPPKPPPPEMHFIPNPNNTEFIYLLGLEAVVDRITQGVDQPVPPVPFICSQCGTDFSSLWKWDKAATRKELISYLFRLETNFHGHTMLFKL